MRIAWLHSDCLSANWLLPEDRAVYVFDDAQLEENGWGLKRIMFVYETLLELRVEIYHGPTVPTLAALAQPHGGLVTVDTPDSWLRERIGDLRQAIQVDLVPAPLFVRLEGRVDLKRFSRYWSKAEKELLA